MDLWVTSLPRLLSVGGECFKTAAAGRFQTRRRPLARPRSVGTQPGYLGTTGRIRTRPGGMCRNGRIIDKPRAISTKTRPAREGTATRRLRTQ